MQETPEESIEIAIQNIETARKNLQDISNLKNIIDNTTEQVQILKENWSTTAGLAIANQINNILDINTSDIINKVNLCCTGEINYNQAKIYDYK